MRQLAVPKGLFARTVTFVIRSLQAQQARVHIEQFGHSPIAERLHT